MTDKKKYSSSAKKTVLLVEDNLINREILKEQISDEYDCLEAENGAEGLDILRASRESISAVLLDLIMPVCSGIEFLEQVSQEPLLATIPVIVMTAETSESVKYRCMELGAIDFLSKLEHPALIKLRLKNIIGLRESAALIGEIETDTLTGLYTRQAFFYYAKLLLEEHKDQRYDLLMLDVQDFKILNTIYGENKCDGILVSMANFISQNVKGGLFGRYDGDRFVCLRPSPAVPYRQWFGLMLKRFDQYAEINQVILKGGIYENVDRSLSVRVMCDRAAVALASVKSDYSRKFAFYDGPVSQKQLREKKYTLDFMEAIREREFIIWYQPKIDPYTGKIAGAEALVRWMKPKGYISPPSEFLDVFEDNGQIIELDEYVFRHVCAQQKKWLDNGVELFPISINLSRKTMVCPGIAQKYREIAEEIGVPLTVIPLEITESAAVRNAMIRPIVEELHNSGFAVHLDDFGTGHSSLNALAVLPIDVVKIDKSIIDNIGSKHGDIIFETMMSLVKRLGIHVVAEGVEEKWQLEFLMNAQVDEIQGFYYSRPLPPEEFEQFAIENLSDQNT